MAITLPITSRTASDDNDFADVYGNDAQLVTEIDARDDNYQTIFHTGLVLPTDAGATTYFLSPGGAATAGLLTVWVSGSSVTLGAAAAVSAPPIFYFDDADYAIASKTQKLRVRAQVSANATQPLITFTFGLYPVTVAGGTDNIAFTAGTVVSGTTVAIASPAASTITSGTSSAATIPADGAYALGVVTSGTLTNNSAVALTAQLQTNYA